MGGGGSRREFFSITQAKIDLYSVNRKSLDFFFALLIIQNIHKQQKMYIIIENIHTYESIS